MGTGEMPGIAKPSILLWSGSSVFPQYELEQDGLPDVNEPEVLGYELEKDGLPDVNEPEVPEKEPEVPGKLLKEVDG